MASTGRGGRLASAGKGRGGVFVEQTCVLLRRAGEQDARARPPRRWSSHRRSAQLSPYNAWEQMHRVSYK